MGWATNAIIDYETPCLDRFDVGLGVFYHSYARSAGFYNAGILEKRFDARSRMGTFN